ncbi:hypothetical protein EDD30_6960 [Couchioplanes caeruleus]|uniref:Uncharacterized protein n=1 Tax=Couchioplanes caeruleus TaxID=56438 RepID=A0A3N1GUV2_9ACTN|nr:hypothetical protein EDD30_6960 [Couchioplanes caeruleus]
MQPAQRRRPSISINRRHRQLSEPIINAFRLLSAGAVLDAVGSGQVPVQEYPE